MIIAIDFDGTVVVETEWNYLGPLQLQPYAKRTLRQLKESGHHLLLYSARNNRALYDQSLDPLVQAGVVGSVAPSQRTISLAKRRYQHMVKFVLSELPGIFDAIDDGRQGKPRADIYIDNKAITFGVYGMEWPEIAQVFGV
jgi:hypothetical protein